VPAPVNFERDQHKVESLGITPRELQMLELIAEGLSNKEVAERVFVSENTVKTHLSRVFDKLGARRRTQAVQLGKELRLIP
jgi:ATP/maltotriose-dependent transcriptional regulator MalT